MTDTQQASIWQHIVEINLNYQGLTSTITAQVQLVKDYTDGISPFEATWHLIHRDSGNDLVKPL